MNTLRRQQAAERRQIASGPPRVVGYTKRFMLSLLRSFWEDSIAETWGWHPMLYAVAAPQLSQLSQLSELSELSELTRGALASPRPQAMLFNHFVVGLENRCPLSLPESREAMIATWVSRHLFSARPDQDGYLDVKSSGLERLTYFRYYTSQPALYSFEMYWSASGQLVAFKFAASHSNALPAR
ncbi:hypothetical protein Pla52n_16340 [Stieleria varia]|uniref:Uncharacterized protein n=1 Tax=Stieleria varia TaxID=2528005 RepID=A0A5C6B1Y3_9BACT|nr:hypothetical protein Pla52n_16340 [Stieleria varia]